MFGRATITLGIGPHSSLRYFAEFGIAYGAHCVQVVEDIVVKKVHVRYLIS